MIINLNPEIIEAFDKTRKVYLLEKFELGDYSMKSFEYNFGVPLL